MGYLTNYEMSPNSESWCEDKRQDIEAFIETTKKVIGWSYLNDIWRGESGGLKWYEHREDMVKLSTAFPGVLFTLWGHGEEANDLWKQYFFNGKCQVALATITYPKFDEEKLKGIISTCPSCYGAGVVHANGRSSIGCFRCGGSGEVE